MSRLIINHLKISIFKVQNIVEPKKKLLKCKYIHIECYIAEIIMHFRTLSAMETSSDNTDYVSRSTTTTEHRISDRNLMSPSSSSYLSWIESVNSEYFGSAVSNVPGNHSPFSILICLYVSMDVCSSITQKLLNGF